MTTAHMYKRCLAKGHKRYLSMLVLRVLTETATKASEVVLFAIIALSTPITATLKYLSPIR